VKGNFNYILLICLARLKLDTNVIELCGLHRPSFVKLLSEPIKSYAHAHFSNIGNSQQVRPLPEA
jgi:hypothetical protein